MAPSKHDLQLIVVREVVRRVDQVPLGIQAQLDANSVGQAEDRNAIIPSLLPRLVLTCHLDLYYIPVTIASVSSRYPDIHSMYLRAGT